MRVTRSASWWAGLLAVLATLACEARSRIETKLLQREGTRLRIDVVGVDDPRRAAMLQRWVEEAADATRTRSGRFPLRDALVRVSETDSLDPSPVPWGQTQRGNPVAVLLYVRPDADAAGLRSDWTAVHELSHLYHPYLGERGRWLAEGLASYWQDILRARAGLLDAEEAWRRLDAGFRRGEHASSGMRLDAMGRTRGGTMRVYWAGAAYWLAADLALRRDHRTTLDAVMDRYARCCLEGSAEIAPETFVATLDRVAGIPMFTPLYARFAAETTFPDVSASLQALGLAREGDTLRFSQGDGAARLRQAIASPRR